MPDQKIAARSARRKTRLAAGLCSLWRTTEVRDRLAQLIAVDNDDARGGCPSDPRSTTPLPSVMEYVAVETLQSSANFACIAQARTEPRQRREVDDAVALPEITMAHGGEDDDGELA